MEAKTIFNYISAINPKTDAISSLGEYVSDLSQMVADDKLREVISFLPAESLAFKIATGQFQKFSDKQLWVIAFELLKNNVFCEKVKNFYDEINLESELKFSQSKVKKQLNKENSAPFLNKIKENGKKLTDYYKWLNNKENEFRSEFFSKKYSEKSVEKFLTI